MVENKELLSQALENYAFKVSEKLFGISSIASQSLIRYGIRNTIGKYSKVIDFFSDQASGELNVPLILDALEGELKARGGWEVFGVRFTVDDVEEIRSIYKTLSNNNNGR